jgi:peroxiredoxin
MVPSRVIGAAACFLLGAAILIAAGLPDRHDMQAFFPAPQTAPPIAARDLHGQPFSLASFRGTPVMVNFWSVTCAPCLLETPLLQTAYTTYQGLGLVGIDSQDTAAEMADWETRFGLTYPLIHDDGTLADAYQIRGLPTTFFIGADGVIDRVVYGPIDKNTLDAELAALLKKEHS